jgi:YD repeat-containing protein
LIWLLSEQSALGTVPYEYDAYGRRSKLTWPDAVNITYTYDNAGHLTGVYRFGGGLVQFTYDVQGRRFGTGRANGATTYYGYDGLSRPARRRPTAMARSRRSTPSRPCSWARGTTRR